MAEGTRNSPYEFLELLKRVDKLDIPRNDRSALHRRSPSPEYNRNTRRRSMRTRREQEPFKNGKSYTE